MEVVNSYASTKHRRKRKTSEKTSSKLKKPKIEDVQRLEKLVIGDCTSIVQNMARILDNDSGLEDENDDFDRESQFSDTLASPPRQPAWQDDDEDIALLAPEMFKKQGGSSHSHDDLRESYQQTLRRRFISVFGEPSWARLRERKPSCSDDEDDAALFQRCGNLLGKRTDLPKSILQTKLIPSLNQQTANEGPLIEAVEFHPTSAVGLVAGSSGIASLFQVDGMQNNKLTSVQFERFPIRCAKFTKDGNKFVVGSNLTAHFHVYDMLAGKSLKIPVHHNLEMTSMKSFVMSPDGRLVAVVGRFGQIHLLTTLSYEWVSTLQMSGEVKTLAFSPDGSLLYSFGESGEIWTWSMSERAVEARAADDGCLAGSCLATSLDGRYVAAGSTSGVVNVYDSSSLRTHSNPQPLKALMNLTTCATFASFDPTSQLLAFGSNDKDSSIKMCHLGSMSVFSNFPSNTSDYHRIQCCAFSPSSGFFSMGNNKSTAFLYRLKYFGNY